MGRGRPTSASAAATSNASRLYARAVPPVETPDEQDLPPAASDDSSTDSDGRKCRRGGLQAVSKEPSASVIIPNQSAKPPNMRSRLRKSTQINHKASLNLAESRIQRSSNYSSNSSTDELLVISDGVLMKSSLHYGMNSINTDGTHDDVDHVANDENVMSVVEISDETDTLSLDTDTLTNESSLVPDSNDVTCMADDEAESSVFSEDSQTRSNSIITVSPEDSNSMQTVDVGKQTISNSTASSIVDLTIPVANASQIEKSKQTSPQLHDTNLVANTVTEKIEKPNAPENNTSHASEPDDRILSSPDFFNLPKPKIVRTYQNKRKLRAEALKNQEIAAVAALSDNKGQLTVEAGYPKTGEEPEISMTSEKATLNVDRPEVTECRRSQRQRVIKYEVRELFNIKGSRNNSDPKNTRISAASHKSAKDSPRSDVSSSPQTFRGFSDTDDPSSPLNFPFRSLSRQSNATPTPPPLLAVKECSTPVKSNLCENVGKAFESSDSFDAQNKTLTPNVEGIDTTKLSSSESGERTKFARNLAKKELKKPLRILPRRKTVLFNRLPDEIDNGAEFDDKTLPSECNLGTSVNHILHETVISESDVQENEHKTIILKPSVRADEGTAKTAASPNIGSIVQCNYEAVATLNEGAINNCNLKTDSFRNETKQENADIHSTQPNSSKEIEKISKKKNVEDSPEISKLGIGNSKNIESQQRNSFIDHSLEKSAFKKADEVQIPKKRGRKPKNKIVEGNVSTEFCDPKAAPSVSRPHNDSITSQTDSNMYTKDSEKIIKKPSGETIVQSERCNVAELVSNSEPSETPKQSCNSENVAVFSTLSPENVSDQIETTASIAKSASDHWNIMPKSNELDERKKYSRNPEMFEPPTGVLKENEQATVERKSPDRKKQSAKRPRTKGEMKLIEDVSTIKKEKFKPHKESSRTCVSPPSSSKRSILKIEQKHKVELQQNHTPKDTEIKNQSKSTSLVEINSKSSEYEANVVNQMKKSIEKSGKTSKRTESPITKLKLNSSRESGKRREESDLESTDTFDAKNQSLLLKVNSMKNNTKHTSFEEIDMFASSMKKKHNACVRGDDKKLLKISKRSTFPKKKETSCSSAENTEASKKNLSTKECMYKDDYTKNSQSETIASIEANVKKQKKSKHTDKSSNSDSTQMKQEVHSKSSSIQLNNIVFGESYNSVEASNDRMHNKHTKVTFQDEVKQANSHFKNDTRISKANSDEKKSECKKIAFAKIEKGDDYSGESNTNSSSSSFSSNGKVHCNDNLKGKKAERKKVDKATVNNALGVSAFQFKVENKPVSPDNQIKRHGSFKRSLEPSLKDRKTKEDKFTNKSRKRRSYPDSSRTEKANDEIASKLKSLERLKLPSKGLKYKPSDTSVENIRKKEDNEQTSSMSSIANPSENIDSSHEKIEEMLKTLDSMHSPVSDDSNNTLDVSCKPKQITESSQLADTNPQENSVTTDIFEPFIAIPSACAETIASGNQCSSNTSSAHSDGSEKQNKILKPSVDEAFENVDSTMRKDKTHGEKKRIKMIFSKSLSTSDGVSDNYSSDSNDSKQPNEQRNIWKSEASGNYSQNENSKKVLVESSDHSIPLVPSISSVLNVLSSDVMNDLLEWTCNNKQTILQIKDSIDLNQKSNLPVITATEIATDCHEEKNVSSLENNNVKADVADKLAPLEIPQMENTVTTEEEITVDNVEETQKDSVVIETSKDMLAELMCNSFDADTDVCSESSESSTKPEPDGKKKFRQEINTLPKASDGDTSTKSSDSDQTDQNSQDSSSLNIRRSHRIKTQTKSTVVGRGLVRDKADRSQNNSSTMVLEAQNAKFLKDMEERLSQFQMIKENEYRCERVISKEAKRMSCDCFLTRDEEDRGELGCGEDCLNRLLMIECSSNCTVGERCTNRRFQKNRYAPCKVFRTEKKGFGILADAEILSGQFIMEYIGEVLNGKQFEKRAGIYSQDKNKHYYFMALRGDSIIDATMKGNISRFINHSCDPNAETQKWTVNGELRIGFFSKRRIVPGEEITFDYQFQRYGKEAQKCFCESTNCRGWIGEEPETEDEEEVTSSESEDESDVKLIEESKKPKLDTDEAIKTGVDVAANQDSEDADKLAAVPDGSFKHPEKSTEKIVSIQKQLDKDKSARMALKAAERFAKIAAKMKAKKERELIKHQTRMAMEDPDLEAQISSLEKIGLKNQPLTLQLSRCMVRAKYLQSKLRILSILQKGEVACRRLFLDYHGLRLLHGWMSEIETTDVDEDLDFRLQTLTTLEILPIPNKTMLKESKVFQVVECWSNEIEQTPQHISSPPVAESQDPPSKRFKSDTKSCQDTRENIKAVACKLTAAWELLPEVFRIPKRERIEQMKEHEREADRLYTALNLGDEDPYNNELRNKERFGAKKSYKWVRDKFDKRKELATKEAEKISSAEANLTKLQRRQLFAAKVAKDEAEKRLAEMRREFEFKCKFYGLDPRYMTPHTMPFCVHPPTGQWYSKEKLTIPTPPSHAHIKVPPRLQSTDPKDYRMPEMDLPPMWKFAMDVRGRLYYYHIKIRIPQWEPPIKILPLTRDPSTEGVVPTEVNPIGEQCASTIEPQPSTSKQALSTGNDASTSDSEDTDSDISCSEIIGVKKGVPLKIGKDMIHELKKSRKRKRFNRLVQERTISPRREEDRLYNQIEMRKYRENKEKIRRRKEEIKRRRALQKKEEAIDSNADSKETPPQPSSSATEATDNLSLPIQDYLLSSDEDELEKAVFDNSLIEKIVHGDKIVDELDAIATEKPLKRSISFVKDHSDVKKRIKLEDKKRTESSKSEKSSKSRKTESGSSKNVSRRSKEKFRSDIAGIIVHHLTPYRRDSCPVGKITTNEDFKHLARKLTHFVLLKELKHCDMTGQTLIVTESVKNKSREFIKKYMAKYGHVYIRPANDPEFRDIPQ